MGGVALSRRSLLGGVVTAPVGVASGSAHAGGSTDWDHALGAYVTARRRHEAFLAKVLDPAVAFAQSLGQGLTPAIIRLEQQGDALCEKRQQALGALIALPAQDLEALICKARLAYAEVLQFEDHHGYGRAILADLERLADQLT